MPRIQFESLREWCKSHWDLDLSRNGGPGSVPYDVGGWTTGYTLSGHFPGCGMGWRRFSTLGEVAVATGYPRKIRIEEP